MRSVLLAARDRFGSASAAAPTPATWINLRREMVIAVRSFIEGKCEAIQTRCGRGQKHSAQELATRHYRKVGGQTIATPWSGITQRQKSRHKQARIVPGLRASARPGGRPSRGRKS